MTSISLDKNLLWLAQKSTRLRRAMANGTGEAT
jgi:hypothetical protein